LYVRALKTARSKLEAKSYLSFGAGNATLSLEYAWQGGSREFQIEIQILPEE
jgi:hypothetical protein